MALRYAAKATKSLPFLVVVSIPKKSSTSTSEELLSQNVEFCLTLFLTGPERKVKPLKSF